jgi:ectoine hydroxylase-related dioxygenase (phytanoyl-CoA dioxygenase family)
LTNKSPTFREALLEHDSIHAISENWFAEESGTYWLNIAQAIEVGPGSKAQPLYRDAVQYPFSTTLGPDGPDLHLNFRVTLTEFTSANGAIRVMPAYQDPHEPFV